MKDVILTADLHLTSVARDKHRFGLFKWLRAQQKKLRADTLFILGDLTDAKDYHSSVLVNKVVDELAQTAESFSQTYILKGNHDGVDPAMPYFRFLNAIPRVRFIIQPQTIGLGCGSRVLALPHTRNEQDDWKGIDFHERGLDCILAHFTAAGSESESGFVLGGVTWEALKKTPVPIISGDVHVPQEIGLEGATTWLTYVGTPYHVRFLENEQPTPRCIHFDAKGKRNDIHFRCPRRRTYVVSKPEDLSKADLQQGDQVKVRVVLDRADFGLWFDYRTKVREICTGAQVELMGVELVRKEEKKRPKLHIAKASSLTPQDMFEKYVKAKGIDAALADAGRNLLQAS